jgi:hypothetical protein
MKKIIFLLIMVVALVGFMPAMETAYPLGDSVLTAELSAIGVDNYFVTAGTAPVAAQFILVLPEGYLFVNYELFINNENEWFSLIKPINNIGQKLDYFSNELGYWLRL